MALRTPLYEVCVRYGARMVEFAGYEMPVQFSGIVSEHLAVRSAAGLFDVSHMGEIEVSGPNAAESLQPVLTNDVAGMRPGQARYALICNEGGGTVDDVVVYRLREDRFMVVANAANTSKDLAWLKERCPRAQIRDRSRETALLALQGPAAGRILTRAAHPAASEMARYAFLEDVSVAGVSCLVSRTGYTGEDGFELYMPAESAERVFVSLMETGAQDGLVPAGLGARDTLRLEARLPLYGHELAEDISPLEAGLVAFVKFDKGPFIGREALARQREEGIRRRIAGFELSGRAIARAGCEVEAAGAAVGRVTSGTYSPTLQKSIGLALMEASRAQPGEAVEVTVRDKKIPGQVVKTPFYRRNTVDARPWPGGSSTRAATSPEASRRQSD